MKALISVYDKSGIIEFAKTLAASGVELISTGGTHRTLSEEGSLSENKYPILQGPLRFLMGESRHYIQ